MKQRLRIPGEWERHEACWVAFPHLPEEWPHNLSDAQKSIGSLCRAIAGPGNEPVRLLVANAEIERHARALIGAAAGIDYVRADYGDCWVRDTAPLFGRDAEGSLGGLRFRFNGWGGKYDIPFDEAVGDWMLDHVGARVFRPPLVLEGGAIESNGSGTFLTTESCVLNHNRNPGLTRDGFERALESLVAVERVVWLERGLAHDHTDGHVDMVARFVSEESVLCMRADAGAPNASVLRSIGSQLRDAGFTVVELPPAPSAAAPDGTPLPATYCNFYVANQAVIVPTYGVREDEAALAVIEGVFPGREVIGLSALDLLCGGGAFHCVTQPLPAAS